MHVLCVCVLAMHPENCVKPGTKGVVCRIAKGGGERAHSSVAVLEHCRSPTKEGQISCWPKLLFLFPSGGAPHRPTGEMEDQDDARCRRKAQLKGVRAGDEGKTDWGGCRESSAHAYKLGSLPTSPET